MEQTLLVVITFVIMLVGLVGIFVPILPGIELVWLAALGYALLHGLGGMSTVAFIIITLVFILGISSDLWITGAGMRATGTSLLSVLVGGFFLLIGSLFLTPLVGILLSLGAILLIEYLRKRDLKKALVSTGTMAASCALTYGFKFAVAIVMIIIWGVWVLQG